MVQARLSVLASASLRARGRGRRHRVRGVYDLRHSFASLLLHEGRSVIDVARQLGHDARLTLTRYGHVIDELDAKPRLAAEDAIRAARATNVPPSFLVAADA